MRRLSIALGILWSGASIAGPFETCETEAFLTQSAVATTYGVNLSTGEYSLVENDMGTKGKVNATGFNPNDNYVYGWSYVHKLPARFGDDWQVEPLRDVDIIANANFYIGDVSSTTNEYFVYRAGGKYGLYSIGLDPSASNYHIMNRVVDGATLNLKIFDLAFHPDNGNAYSVDRSGNLYEIDTFNGTATNLGQTGEDGVFGAVYFDVDGKLYFSRNKDGHIFFVDINNADYSAELFAIGPSASVNDGARCALAPVVDATNADIDFGDAPESYGTYLTDNGARHGLSGGATLYMGGNVDGESDGSPFPMSDDTIDNNNDDDGVQFATTFRTGETAILLVDASQSGYLTGWVDFNQNGEFDSDEQIVDKAVGAGSNTVYVAVPQSALGGDTWARFRISSSQGVQATGGTSDGEVEDYPVGITSVTTSISYYPSSSEWTTIAFEDNWPIEGDYDLNDMVVYLRTATRRENGLVTHVKISGEISAVGAAYQNGFAIRLPGIMRSDIDEANVNYTINDLPVGTYNPLEAGRQEAIFVFMYNVWSYVSAGEDCTFYRTEVGCGSNVQARFEISIPMAQPVDSDISGVFDPFMFSTPGAWHGAHFDSPPGRSYEIHLKNQAPTEAFDWSLANVADGVDASDPASDQYFQTTNGLPWALEIGTRWQYPVEYIDLLLAYPLFENYVNTSGLSSTSWYLQSNANQDVLFTD